MGMEATVTYWEKHNWELYMTFRKLPLKERERFKKLVEETLSITEITELSKISGSAFDNLVLSKLNTN